MGQEPTPMTTSTSQTTGGAPETNDPDVIREDIDRTRNEMEGTLAAINDRVNPQRVYERRSGRVRQRWSSFRSSVMGNDEPVYGEATSSYRAGGNPSGREPVYYEGDRYDDSSSWRDRTPDVDMRGRSEQAKQAVSDAPQKVQRQTRGNPLTAGMIAFGIGTLIGSALPETDAERRAAREAANRVDVEGAKQRLTEHAQDIKGSVQDKAQDAAEDLKSSAQDKAQDVKGHAQQEGQRVKDDAQQRGEEVRRQS